MDVPHLLKGLPSTPEMARPVAETAGAGLWTLRARTGMKIYRVYPEYERHTGSVKTSPAVRQTRYPPGHRKQAVLGTEPCPHCARPACTTNPASRRGGRHKGSSGEAGARRRPVAKRIESLDPGSHLLYVCPPGQPSTFGIRDAEALSWRGSSAGSTALPPDTTPVARLPSTPGRSALPSGVALLREQIAQ